MNSGDLRKDYADAYYAHDPNGRGVNLATDSNHDGLTDHDAFIQGLDPYALAPVADDYSLITGLIIYTPLK